MPKKPNHKTFHNRLESLFRFNIVSNVLTCITRALCTLIQNANFSSCVIFLGSISSNREIRDLQSRKVSDYQLLLVV